MNYLSWIINLNWSEIITAIATLWLAFTAWKGLNAWRDPISHKIKLKNIEDLIEKVSELQILMESHSTYIKTIRENYKKNNSTNLIEEFSKELNEVHKELLKNYTNKVTPVHSKIKVLLQKAEHLEFKDFDVGREAHNRLEALSIAIVQFLISASVPWKGNFKQVFLQNNMLFLEEDPQEILKENLGKLTNFAGEAQKKLLNIK